MHCALKRDAMCGSPEKSKANRWAMMVNDSWSMAKSNLNLDSEPQNVFFLAKMISLLPRMHYYATKRVG